MSDPTSSISKLQHIVKEVVDLYLHKKESLRPADVLAILDDHSDKSPIIQANNALNQLLLNSLGKETNRAPTSHRYTAILSVTRTTTLTSKNKSRKHTAPPPPPEFIAFTLGPLSPLELLTQWTIRALFKNKRYAGPDPTLWRLGKYRLTLWIALKHTRPGPNLAPPPQTPGSTTTTRPLQQPLIYKIQHGKSWFLFPSELIHLLPKTANIIEQEVAVKIEVPSRPPGAKGR